MRGWLDDFGSKVRNAFERAARITLLSTKTVSKCTSTSTPATKDPHRYASSSYPDAKNGARSHPKTFVRACSLAISFEPLAHSSYATARDQPINNNKRRFPSLPPLLPIAEKEDSVKIPVGAATVARRLAIIYIDERRRAEKTGVKEGIRRAKAEKRLAKASRVAAQASLSRAVE